MRHSLLVTAGTALLFGFSCTDTSSVPSGGPAGAVGTAASGASGEGQPTAASSAASSAGGVPSSGSAEVRGSTPLAVAAGSAGNPGGAAGVEPVAGAAAGDAGAPLPPAVDERCQAPSDTTIPPVRWTELVSGLEQPIYVTAAPGDGARLFVIEKPGRIRVLRDGQLLEEPFLDITDRVQSSVEEMGLLGLAFHPRYADNGLFYLTYSTDPQGGSNPAHTEVLAEFHVRAGDPERADTAERRLLTVAKPQGNHNGGNLQFRADGFLYYGVGDGGGADDEHGSAGNGQALDTFMGKLLRIDVDGRGAGADGQYAIPPGNYAERDPRALPELWSVGLRNPWRFSFDRCNGDLYIGDVGQEGREEVDYIPGSDGSGRNFGWRLMEAENCFNPDTGCDASAQGLTLPLASYGRQVGQCIIGGYVYRGSAIPALRGAYLYGDYESAVFFALRAQAAGAAAEPVDITANLNPGKAIDEITSFGQDNAGELYLTTFTGSVYRLDPR
ncbi:MAG TPA: PQQ-dependent sugar dehydrogenase [Polyangiaceae bacterium]|nr:PQQ-dependent sugar dehydrogenase [Polyangiaceae bacterium]